MTTRILEKGVFDIEQYEKRKNCFFLLRALPRDMIRLLYQFVNYDPAINRSKILDWNLGFRKICFEFSDSISVEDCSTVLECCGYYSTKDLNAEIKNYRYLKAMECDEFFMVNNNYKSKTAEYDSDLDHFYEMLRENQVPISLVAKDLEYLTISNVWSVTLDISKIETENGLKQLKIIAI